jgi:hypothetical protein
MDDKFKRAPHRKRQAVRKVVLSPDAKAHYEDLSRERHDQQRRYVVHLPSDKPK